MTYREPASVIDATAVAIAEVQEKAATLRKRVEETEETKRARAKEYGFVRTLVVGAVAAVGVIAGAIVGNSYVESRRGPGACHEETWSRSTYGGLTCGHPLHVLVETEKSWTCRCGVARLP